MKPAGTYRQKTNGTFVLILNDREEFLVGEMTYKGGLLTLPGGGVERGEPYDVAAVIEQHEEVSDFRTAGELRLVAAMPQRIPSDPHAEGTLILYECRAVPGREYRSRDGELKNIRFISIDAALEQVKKFHRPMLRLAYLAHACRHAKGSPGHFSANMTSPVFARRSNGQFVCI